MIDRKVGKLTMIAGRALLLVMKFSNLLRCPGSPYRRPAQARWRARCAIQRPASASVSLAAMFVIAR